MLTFKKYLLWRIVDEINDKSTHKKNGDKLNSVQGTIL